MSRFSLLLVTLLVLVSSVDVEAKTGRPLYTVELNTSSGGKITPDIKKVHQGTKNVKFQIKEKKGFVIADVSLNGTSLGRVPVVTVPVAEGPISILAIFANGTPTVDAGQNVTTFAGVPVTLNPAVTPAIPGDSVEYDWKILRKPERGKATLIAKHTENPTFVAARPGYYEVQLRVTEGKNDAFDTTIVRVLPSPESNPPVARISGPSSALVGQLVTFSGSSSYDPSELPLKYEWELVSKPQGSSAFLSNTNVASPQVTPDVAGTYVVKLEVANEFVAGEPVFLLFQARQNAAPVAEAGADQTVLPGTTVTLDGSTSHDPDDDVLSFSWTFQSCPQSQCPQLTNYSSPTPSFVAALAGSYTLRLSVNDGNVQTDDTVRINASVSVPSEPSLFTRQWQYGVFGTNIGLAGMHVADIDGDGSPEVVATASSGGFGSNSYWYILRQSTGGTYEQVWRSENYESTIIRLLVTDATDDGKADVVIALADGTVKIIDGPKLTETLGITVPGPLSDMVVADVDNDGKVEVVTSNGTGLFVYSAETGGQKWALPAAGGTSIAIGNVDGDSSPEIVTTTSGGKGYVIDAASKTIQWEYANGFGWRVRLGDLDGDGMDEIVGAARWYKITIFDADRKTPAWEVAADLDIDALLVVDVDNDGKSEIVYGDGQWGSVYAIDSSTHQAKWTISNPDHGVQGLAFGDADNDGTKEVLWSGGGSSTGADHLYIADPKTGTVEWKSTHIDGPMAAVDAGDVDGDGDDEIVMVTWESDSGYEEGVIHIFDAKTHTLEYQQKLGIMDWMGVRSVRIGDVNGDGKNEFVVTTANVYDGIIRVYDGATREVKYDSARFDGNYFSAIAIADVDGDGKTEIIAGQGREHTGADGSYLLVFDGETLQEKWRSVDLGIYWGSVYDIKISDIDGDGNQEIIAALGNQLVIYDGVTHDLEHLSSRSSLAMEVADIDEDGTKELLVGREDGKIDVLGGDFNVKRTVPTSSNSRIDALRVKNVVGDGAPEWFVAHGGVIDVLDGKTQQLKWQSENLSGNLGLFNHLVVRDTDGDNRQEVIIGGNTGLFHIEQTQ